jgi:hypothetical protein
LAFNFEKSKFPTGLFEDISNISLSAPPKGWEWTHDKSLPFTATPKNDTAGKIGADSLEFEISGIIVNSEPGKTEIQMTQNIVGDPTPHITPAPLVKTYPELAIRDFQAEPQSVDYGGKTTVKWQVSLGSVITLEYNGKKITHVKDQPSVLLPSTGSYDIDTPLSQSITFTLVAASGKSEVSAQTEVSIAPPTVALTVTDVGAPFAKLDWKTTRNDKKPVLTVTTGTNIQTKILDPSGTMTLPIVSKTTFEITAKNPATVLATTATHDFDPGQYKWAKVGRGPDPSAPATQIFSSHMGLVLVTSSMPKEFKKGDKFDEHPHLPLPDDPRVDLRVPFFSNVKKIDKWGPKYPYKALYLSQNGADWKVCGDFPFVEHTGKITMAHGGGKTYLAMLGGEAKFDGTILGKPKETLFYVTTDFVKWTPLPKIKTIFNAPVPMCVDDNGALFAVSYVLTPIYEHNFQSLQKFSPDDNKWQLLSAIPNPYIVNYIAPAWTYTFINPMYDFLTIHWIDKELVLLSCFSFCPGLVPTEKHPDYEYVGTCHMIDATNTMRSPDGAKWNYVPAAVTNGQAEER